jgi:hypothetical protein
MGYPGTGETEMMIEINPAMLDDLVRAWLKEALEVTEFSLSRDIIHPEDKETYEKDVEAIKRLLDYVGESA